jgi:hypothetical protein
MRSWDGRLTTDSAAASIVTQARYALWPLILEPKLGKELAGELPLVRIELCRGRDRDARPTPTGFRRATKTGTRC